MTASPYLHYDQVFVILRVDTSADQERAPGTGVALLKALWSEAAAEEEVERLNQSNRERASVYFWKATRLVRRVAQPSAV